MKKYLLVSLSMIVWIGCDDPASSEKVSTASSSEIEEVESFDDLPNCTSSREGKIISVQSSDSTFRCKNSSWVPYTGNSTDATVSVSCTLEEQDDGSGYLVICGEEVIGELKNGAKGEQGEPGSAGSNGAPGSAGSNGLSAYEIAKANGFSGTEEEWIASLKGEQGEPGSAGSNGAPGSAGSNGLSAYQIAVANGFSGTEEEWIASLKGEQGEPGTVTVQVVSTTAGLECGVQEVASGFYVVCNGEIVDFISRESITPSSSSQKSSSSMSSSSNISSSESFSGIEPMGSCTPSTTKIAKGETVTWTFTATNPYTEIDDILAYQDMLLTSTCEWNLQGSVQGTSSMDCKTKLSTTAQYNQHGAFTTVLNISGKNFDCGTVQVEGSPITGCSCTADNTRPDITFGSATVTWTVDGCTSEGGELSYAWSGATGFSTMATKTFYTSGTTASPYVVVSNSEGISKQISCPTATATATAVPITGCTCDAPELISASNDVDEFSPVIYQWKVHGCENSVNDDFTYSWQGQGITNGGASTVYGQYTEMGDYTASVTVTNGIGNTKTIQCPNSARVNNSGWLFRCNPDNSTEMTVGNNSRETVTAGTCMVVNAPNGRVQFGDWSAGICGPSGTKEVHFRNCTGAEQMVLHTREFVSIDAGGSCPIYLYVNADICNFQFGAW